MGDMQDQQKKQLVKASLSDNIQEFSSIRDSQGQNSTLSDYELLCQAIKFGRRRVAYYLLDKGCCVSKPGSTNLLLHLAIERLSEGCGWANIALKLLYAGARVSDRNANGDTAVHLGFVKGVEGHVLDFLVKVYLEQSENDAVNKDGFSVLHVACTRPKVEFVREFVMRRHDVNRRVPRRPNAQFAGYTPLHIAVECGNHEVVSLLLKNGADIYAQNLNGSTPLHLACYSQDSRLIDLILAHDRVTANVIDNNGLSHFMVACTSNEAAFAKEHLRVANCKPWTSVETLISSCTNNVTDNQFAGYTPLHFAAEFGSSAVFELLMNRGARCCAMTGRLLTPLTLADKNGHEHVARLFKRYCMGYEVYEGASERLIVNNCTDVSVSEIVGSKSVLVDERADKVDKSVPDCLVRKKPNDLKVL